MLPVCCCSNARPGTAYSWEQEAESSGQPVHTAGAVLRLMAKLGNRFLAFLQQEQQQQQLWGQWEQRQHHMLPNREEMQHADALLSCVGCALHSQSILLQFAAQKCLVQ